MPFGPGLVVPPLPPPPVGLPGQQGGIPPPAPPPPIVAAAQPPFPADTGSIAREIWNQTAGQTPAQLVAQTHGMNVMYGEANPNYERIVETITTYDGLMFFFTISRTSGMVSVVHSAKRYNGGFGFNGPAHMRYLVMVGEKVGDQMPPWMMAPAAGLQEWLRLAEYVVPTRAALVAELEANPPAALATTTVGQAGNAGVVTARVSKLAFVPLAWAPYFLTEMTPWSVVKELERLILTLPVDLRSEVDGLLAWAMLACTRESVASQDSILHARWQPIPPMDRKCVLWQQERLQRILKVPAQQPISLDPTVAFQAALELAKAYRQPSEPATNKRYTQSELKQLRSNMSVGIHEMEDLMTDMNVQSVLAKALQAPAADFPVLINISQELVKDVKDFQYSTPFDTSFFTCHRGITVFAVQPLSLKLQQEKRLMQERFSRASHTTIDDVKMLEGGPSALPQDYTSLCQRLNAYLRLLTNTVGVLSFHTIQVRAMYSTLLRRVDIFSEIQPRQILYFLWAIFLDSRYFFSQSVEDHEELPDSTLNITALMLERGSISMDIIGVPEESFLELVSPAMGPGGYSGPQGPSSLFPPTQRPPQEPTGNANKKVNRALPAEFREVMTPLLRTHPNVNVITIMNASNPSIKHPEITLGKGKCLNYHLLGVCTVRNCSFKHSEEPLDVEPARMKEILSIIKPNVETYCQEAARAKRPRTGQHPIR
jgi:hypothetical protein